MSTQGRTFGYARVSSRDQNLARQIDALSAFGVEPDFIYEDKASGKDFDRPAYKRMLRRIREGDTVVVKSIDRLGRNYREILDQWYLITEKKNADIVVLDLPLLDTRHRSDSSLTDTLISDIMLQLLGYVAEMERDFIRQRQAEGIAQAKARGVRLGRPPLKRPDNFEDVAALVDAKELTYREAAERLGCSVGTVCKWMGERGERQDE